LNKIAATSDIIVSAPPQGTVRSVPPQKLCDHNLIFHSGI